MPSKINGVTINNFMIDGNIIQTVKVNGAIVFSAAQQLDTPTGLYFSGSTLRWNNVGHANSYNISVTDPNGITNIYTSGTNSYSLQLSSYGSYVCKVQAVSNTIQYTNSNWSSNITYSYIQPSITYTITLTVNNGSYSGLSNPYLQGSNSGAITINPDTDYSLPASISSIAGTYSGYDFTNGQLNIYGINSNIRVVINCEWMYELVEVASVSVSEYIYQTYSGISSPSSWEYRVSIDNYQNLNGYSYFSDVTNFVLNLIDSGGGSSGGDDQYIDINGSMMPGDYAEPQISFDINPEYLVWPSSDYTISKRLFSYGFSGTEELEDSNSYSVIIKHKELK